MKSINLSNVELFESLLEIDLENDFIDLHNDYDFKSYEFSGVKNLTLAFVNIKTKNELLVCFEDVELIKFNITVENENSTIDNFHRGRYQKDEKLFDEFENRKCFYIEFLGKSNIELLASKLYIRDYN